LSASRWEFGKKVLAKKMGRMALQANTDIWDAEFGSKENRNYAFDKPK